MRICAFILSPLLALGVTTSAAFAGDFHVNRAEVVLCIIGAETASSTPSFRVLDFGQVAHEDLCLGERGAVNRFMMSEAAYQGPEAADYFRAARAANVADFVGSHDGGTIRVAELQTESDDVIAYGE